MSVTWKNLSLCGCGAGSAEGIDLFCDVIAKDLESVPHPVVVDFGAGGCLGTLILMSRLLSNSASSEFDLYLVDLQYKGKAGYTITVEGENQPFHTSSSRIPPNPFHSLSKLCAILLDQREKEAPKGKLRIHIVEDSKALKREMKKLKVVPKMHFCLYSLDPPDDRKRHRYFQDFANTARFLCELSQEKKPFFYQLDDEKKDWPHFFRLTSQQVCEGKI